MRNFGSFWIDLIKLVNIPHSCFLCLLFSLFVCFHQRSNEIGVEAMMVLEQSVSRGSPASKQVSAPAESSNALLPLTNTLLCSALNLLHSSSTHSAWPLCPSETLLSPFPHIQLELLEREEYSGNVNCKEPHGFSFLWQWAKMLDNKRITQALVSPCHSLSGANVPLGVLSDIWEPTSFYISTWWLRRHNVTVLYW